MQTKLLKAFFHKGRKTFVPWMAFELARKLDMPQDQVVTGLRSLAAIGYVRSRKAERDAEGRSTWALTELGKSEAENMIRADELMRAGR